MTGGALRPELVGRNSVSVLRHDAKRRIAASPHPPYGDSSTVQSRAIFMLYAIHTLRRHTMARTPIHPGEHLAEELKELNISAAELARQIEVPVNRVTGI